MSTDRKTSKSRGEMLKKFMLPKKIRPLWTVECESKIIILLPPQERAHAFLLLYRYISTIYIYFFLYVRSFHECQPPRVRLKRLQCTYEDCMSTIIKLVHCLIATD